MRYVVLDTRYLVPGTRGTGKTGYQVVGGWWYQVVPGTWYQVVVLVPDTRYLVPSAWNQVPGTWYVHATRYLVPATKYLVGATIQRRLAPGSPLEYLSKAALAHPSTDNEIANRFRYP